ncbi:DUF4145 domain-containing protein [Melittangium boletus]|uniref:DUF4145 domain-containing protein n=1 Tax=Melittangium boletus DSM 14713 TaxID=1294270 RepID=A0A250IE40_9BACT|nr:hypothetical protein MEBOL_002948 [Melittangium boletus DSM 14713]
MAILREKWTATFTKDSAPSWPCPRCAEGTLATVKSSFSVLITADSREEEESNPGWEPNWRRGRFSGHLKCTRSECAELVIVCGDTRWVIGGADHHGYSSTPPRPCSVCQHLAPKRSKTNSSEFGRSTGPTPHPAPTVFELAWNCFSTTSKSSEPQRAKNKTKTVRLNLHHRIDILKQNNADLAQTLMAMKWVGNAGSHVGELTREDVLDGLELLEHTLIEVFDPREKELVRMRNQIIKRKGPRKRS